MTSLVIVESPNKVRSIAGYLGDGFVVDSSVGHIRDLPDTKRNPVPAKYKGEPWVRLQPSLMPDRRPNVPSPLFQRSASYALRNATTDV